MGKSRKKEVGSGRSLLGEVKSLLVKSLGPGSHIYTKTELPYAPSPWLPSALQPSIHAHIPEISE